MTPDQWQRVTAALRHLESLSAEQVEGYFSGLAKSDTELATLLRQLWERRPGDLRGPRTSFAPGPEVSQENEDVFRLVLTVIEGPHLGTQFPFTQHDTFLVGRGKKAHFRLPSRDDALSRLHFMVEVNPPHCRVLDLGSTNGTYVNGQRAAAADLQDGDEIRAGVTLLKVSLEEEEGITRQIMAPPVSRPPSEVPGATGEWQRASQLPEAQPMETPEPGPDPVIGQPFAGYLLLRQLGSGGMGVVYLAQRLSDSQVVALKTIRPAVAGSQQQMDRFLREAEILRQLRHPGIVAFQDIGEHEGTLFFVMEHVPGTDAATLLHREGPFAVSRAVGLICQLLEALQYAHEQGFVHRDIKPANLMVVPGSDQERVRLVDFGLARVYQDSPLSGLTMSGQIGGTPAYLAPEQITDFRNVKAEVDQYGAAATLYTLLTNQFVYEFPKQSYERIAMILQQDPVPLRSRRPELPGSLAEVIHRALAREATGRFASAEQMRQALLPFAS